MGRGRKLEWSNTLVGGVVERTRDLDEDHEISATFPPFGVKDTKIILIC